MLARLKICNQKMIAKPEVLAIIASMNRKHQQTLEAIFSKPTKATVAFRDIEALLLALGCELTEGAGSRVRFDKEVVQTDKEGKPKATKVAFLAHRPHPGKEAKRYQVEQVREYIEIIGVLPCKAK